MKTWWMIGVLACMATVGWSVVSYPPGRHTVYVESAVPAPTPRPAPATVTLLFGGDVMLSRSVGDVMAARNDWTWPFALIASETRTADLTVVNLESVIASRGAQTGCGYCFRADPRAVGALGFAGIDIVSLANNHAWDYGLPALEDALSILASSGIDVSGAGRTGAQARSPVIRTLGGTRIAFLAYTDLLPEAAGATDTRAGANRFDPARAADDVARARAQADLVVVSFHAGTEYELTHHPDQERIYRSLIDAGADLVVGHHPHVVQDSERYGRGWIFYSLGNFIFDQSWSAQTRAGALLRVTVQDRRISDAVLVPIDISTRYQASLRP